MSSAMYFRNPKSQSVFAPSEIASMESVVDAVCLELGVTLSEKARRKAVAQRVIAAYERGNRLPLNMVSAGLAECRV